LVSTAPRFTRAWISEPGAPDRIGILADSHGNAALIDRAAAVLESRGCTMCFHLGDIIDTTRPESVDACLKALETRQIKAVRGNNEHTLLLNRSAWLSPEAMEIIRAMPFGRRIGSALLVHSLPFDDVLGARCLLEDMDLGYMRRFSSAFPGTQLFRGHSHQPEIVQLRKAAFARRPMTEGRPVPLAVSHTVVVTCGALADGLCLIWNRHQETVELIALGVA